MKFRNLFFGLVIILFLVGGVSGAVNYAASANGGVHNMFMTDAFGGSDVCCGYYDGPFTSTCSMPCPSPNYQYLTVVIDENGTTKEGFFMNSGGAGRRFNLHSQVTLDSPKNLNSISYDVYTSGSADSTVGSCSGHAEEVYVHYFGTPIDSWNSIAYYGPLTGRHTRNIVGNYQNVDGIYLKLCFNTGGAPDAKVYEIEALGSSCGDGTCDIDEICGDTNNAPECNADCGACPETNTCSNENQTIMKLFQPTNSHGALWSYSGGDYPIDICYTGTAPANPHPECTVDNSFLWLTADYNSHASTYKTDDYNIGVCYGDLSCRVVDESDDGNIPEYCAVDEKEVVALYQNTNSHLTDPNYLPDGIISLWKFDEDVSGVTSLTFKDSVGDNDGTWHSCDEYTIPGCSGETQFYDGKIRKAELFEPDDKDYIEVADDNSLDLTTFTLGTWINIYSLHPGSILIKGEDLSNDLVNYEIQISKLDLLSETSYSIKFVIENTDYAPFRYWAVYPIDESYLQKFMHIAYTFEGGELKFYINGVDRTEDLEIYSQTLSGVITPVLEIPADFLPTTVDSPLFIGAFREKDGNIKKRFFNGLIDEVAIYNRALTSEEVQHRYNVGVYEKKICCKSAPIEEIYWANMSGDKITSAEIGDTVLMIYEGMAGENGNYDFTIYESDDISRDDLIKTINADETFVYGNDLAAKWEITKEDWEKDVISDPEFIFRVSTAESEDLIVPENSYNNSPPQTQIINPISGANYTIDGSSTREISFNQSSSDEDDDLKILWDFGDGSDSGWLLNCLTSGDCNTTHSYSDSGYKIIKLTAEEMERVPAQSAVNYTGIYVYKPGINVFAVISEPEFGKPQTGRFVKFDGGDSFAANCSLKDGECETGYCLINDTIDLCCKKIANASDSSLILKWSFDGTEDSKYENKTSNTKFFSDAGKHLIKLKVGYLE